MTNKLDIVILAAGAGTRMRSAYPKVLHSLAGRPLLEHVVIAAQSIDADNIHVVYGHGGDKVRQSLDYLDVNWVMQDKQLGTGHAVEQAMPLVDDDAVVLVLYGDVPLISTETLNHLMSHIDNNNMALLTAMLDEPTGYGRIVRDDNGHVIKIVEEKDANADEKGIREINTGILAAPAKQLKSWLSRLENNNQQAEYYLTDIIEMAVTDHCAISAIQAASIAEITGVNSRSQLAALERSYQQQQALILMDNGATLADPSRIDVRGSLVTGQDVFIDINVVFEGDVILGERVQIGPNCVIRDSVIADDVVVLSHCVFDRARVGAASTVGPYARLRPETVLDQSVHIGNFVEIKKSHIGDGSKVNHLSYIGDSTIGRGVNVGAGVITCNYDGANKFQTVIEDNVFIGSDSQLIAPVRVGEGATIGAGSTITRDVDKNALALTRVPQRVRDGWVRPKKKTK